MTILSFRNLDRFDFNKVLRGLEEESYLSKEQWEGELNFILKKEKRVTILGSTDRMRFLKNIKIVLVEKEYNGIIIEELPHLKYETPRQKVHSFLSTSKFVVADNCIPCGELLELEYCKNSGVITAIMTKKGKKLGSWMTIDFHIHSKDFWLFDYDREDLDYIRKFMNNKVIKWVSKRCNEREKELNKVKKKYGYN